MTSVTKKYKWNALKQRYFIIDKRTIEKRAAQEISQREEDDLSITNRTSLLLKKKSKNKNTKHTMIFQKSFELVC